MLGGASDGGNGDGKNCRDRRGGTGGGDRAQPIKKASIFSPHVYLDAGTCCNDGVDGGEGKVHEDR